MHVIGGCASGKIGYLDDLDAITALDELRRKHDGAEKNERSTYICELCGMHHLTSWRLL